MVSQYVEFLRTEVRPYFGSRERKSLRQQWQETRELWARYRCVPYHYFKHRLYERSARPDFIDYVPAKLVQRFRNDRNPRSLVHMTNDKLETIRVLAGTGIRCVETLFSVTAGGTVLRGDGEADGEAVAADTAAEALRGHGGTLFVKPIDSRAGYGAFSIGAAEIDAAWIESMRNVVIQPVLRNHPIIDALNAGALNTVRVATLVEDGRCTLIAASLRVAQGKAVVDNWSQGGIAIGVDLTSGALGRSGVTNAKYGRRVHAMHPDTGVRFGSVTLPWWRETLELAERAALGLQPNVTLGLDIAITPHGPVFVEANEAHDFFSCRKPVVPSEGALWVSASSHIGCALEARGRRLSGWGVSDRHGDRPALAPETAQPAIDALKRRTESKTNVAPMVTPEAWRAAVMRMRDILIWDDIGAARDVMRELLGTLPVEPGEGYVTVQVAAPNVMLMTGTGKSIQR